MIDQQAKIIWDYLLLRQPLKKADVILVLGNRDTRMARYAARLYLDGWAPLLLCSGSGSIHNHVAGRARFIDTTEAEVFAKIAIDMGVPEDKIIIEDRSQNTQQNFIFSLEKLKEKDLVPKHIILIQKPFTVRRILSMGKKYFPQAELIASFPDISYEDYPDETTNKNEFINFLVGAIDRMKKNPNNEYPIKQIIPQDVEAAYQHLMKQGYTEKTIGN